MQIDQVAVILFTLRDYCKTPADLRETLKRVREIGYQAVQVSGVGPIATEVIKELLDEAGLVCCATHEDSDVIRSKPEEVVAKLETLNCQHTAYPFPMDVDFEDEKAMKTLVCDLDEAGRILRESGKTLCYHNHGHELYRRGDKTVLDYIYQETARENLQGELDTFWIQAGGANPLEWIRKMEGRLPLLHLKDYAINLKGERYFAEIGYGNLAWPEIIFAAEDAGCQWFIVEQDFCPGNPFDSIKKSFDFINEHLCES